MYCLKCGTQLADTAKFCHVCGTPVKRIEAPAAPPPPPPQRVASPSRAGSRRLLGCGAALLGGLLVVGLILAAAYFLLGLHRTSGITEIAPDDAAAVVVIRPDLRQLNQLRDVDRLAGSAAAFAPLALAPGVSDFVFEIAGDYGLYFQGVDVNPTEDVLPWIGREVGLAAMDRAGAAVVAAAAVRNEARATAFLADLRGQLEAQGIEFAETNHGGVAVTEVVGPDHLLPLAFAVNDGRLLLASDRATLEDTLDRAEDGGETLANNDAFRDALAAQPGNRLGYVYIDPAALGGGATELAALRWIGGAYALTGDGTRFSYKLGFDRDRMDGDMFEWLASEGVDNRLAGRVPADTIIYVAGGSLALALENVAAQTSDFEEALEEIQNDVSLSGLYELLELMTGEFALAVSRQDEGLLAAFDAPYGVLVVSEVEDGDEALEGLDNIFDNLSRDLGVEYRTDEVDNVPVGFLADGFSGRLLGYGVDGREVFLGTPDSLVESALEADDVLGDDARFRATFDGLPGGGLFYVYFDAAEIRTLLDLLGVSMGASETYVERIEAIGLAVEPIANNGEMNAELFFLTEPRR